MPPAKRAPEDGDSIGVHIGQRASECERGMPIGALRGDVEQLPGLAGRAAKVAVVEDDGVVSGGCEALCVAALSDAVWSTFTHASSRI